MIKEIHPKQAYKLLSDTPRAVLVDVRSSMEYDYVGHPVNSVHVPIKEPPGWETDADFVENLKEKLKRDRQHGLQLENIPLLLLCRSGKRSELGAGLLIEAGFNNVFNIVEGFEGDRDENGHRNTLNGWRFHQLPWQQS